MLNYDDDRTRAMAARTRAQALTVGLEGFGADLTAYNVVLGATGTGFDVRYGTNRYVGRWSPLLGTHQLYAALAALAVGTHYDIAPADALKALTTLLPLPGRMNPLNGIGGALLIDDSYSADPESTLSALEWLHTVTDEKHRAIFIFGDMDNLGDVSPARASRRRAARGGKCRSVHHGRHGRGAGGSRRPRSGHGRRRRPHHLQHAGRRCAASSEERAHLRRHRADQGRSVGAHRTDHARAAGERSR